MDWRDRFRAPATYAASIATNDPTRGVIISDRDGALQAYAWDTESGAVRALTSGDAATIEAAISGDGTTIYLHIEDEPGSEIGHLHGAPFEGGESTDLTPNLPGYAIDAFRERDGLIFGLAGFGGDTKVLVIDRDSITTHPVDTLPLAVDLDRGSGVIALTEASPGRGMITRVRAVSVDADETLGTLEGAKAGAIKGKRLAVAISDGEWDRPALWTVGSDPEPIHIDAPGDVVPTDWSADGSAILLHQQFRGTDSLFLFDVGSGRTTPLSVPAGAMRSFSHCRLIDNDHALSVWSDARTPWRPVISSAGEWRVANGGEVPVLDGAEWEEVTFPSTDGIEIQGWLLLPPGTGPWPTILYTHGGPTAVQQPIFHPLTQAWVDHGFALLSVNYRGSTTFGESFREALTNNIGIPDVEDVIAAHRWLVESGIADPRRIIKNGYSYGGYLTLQALGTHPDLWAGGVAGAPIADWTLMFDLSNDILRAYDLSMFGGSPEELPDRYREASPLSYADDFVAPVFISQPENDTRTPLEPVQVFVDALDARGKPVEMHLMRAGHAGSGTDDDIEMMERWLDFCDRVLSGSPS